MRMTEIVIQNFRAIHEATIAVSPYTLLVGANNAGKSTVVDCLRAFYAHEKYSFQNKRDFPNAPERIGMESFVEIEFVVSDDERELLPEQYRLEGNCLRTKKWFANPPEGRTAGTIYGFEVNSELSENPMFGAANVQRGKLGNVIYIPAISKVDEHTKLSGPSALRDTIDELLKAVVADSPAYQEFSDHFSRFVQDVRTATTDHGHSLDGFAEALSEKLGDWGARFGLTFNPPAPQEITKHLVDWQITDVDGNAHEIDQFGSGFQRHLIASLIRTRSEFKATPQRERRTFTPDLNLLLFEEPEAYLHPPQQGELARNLRTITEQPGWQVIASTHSPQFVSRNTDDLRALVRLRVEDRISSVYQLNEGAIEEIFSARAEIEALLGHWEALSDDERAELERVRYFLWLDNERCTLFFCDFVILVEGPTEAALVSRLIDDERIVVPAKACSILHSDGKYNTMRFVRLLDRLGLPFFVIHDRDSKTKDLDLNDLIREEIERSSFCCGLEVLDPNLEVFLGWPTPNEGNRRALKPGMILMNYESRGTTTPALDELCERINRALEDVDDTV